MDVITDGDFSLFCVRFLRQKGNNFHIQGNDSKKGQGAQPRPHRALSFVWLLPEPPPSVEFNGFCWEKIFLFMRNYAPESILPAVPAWELQEAQAY
jgi:hypothetical protein